MADKTMVDYTRKIKPYFEGVAPIEPTTTAASAHAIGDMFYLDGTLVVATAAISIGDTITVGTNVVAADDVVTLLAGKAKKSTLKTATLSVGSTSVTFTGLPTTGNNLIDFFNSAGINYTDIDTSTSGQVTLTFEAQEVAVTVYCEIREA